MPNNQSTVSPARRPLLFLTLLLGLSACAGTSSVGTLFPPVSSSEVEAAQPVEKPRSDASEEKKHAENVEFYLDAADQAQGKEREALRLQAAEAAYFSRQEERSLEILSDLDTLKLSLSQQRRVVLLLAELGQFADRPLTLLSKLPAPTRGIPEDIAARILAVRSHAQLTLGQTLDAVSSMVAQEAFIRQPTVLREHRDNIWRTLRSAPPMINQAAELPNHNRQTRGWVELANVMLDLWLGPDELDRAIENWERSYPNHPAHQTVFFKEFKQPAPAPQPLQRTYPGYTADPALRMPGQAGVIALLLPLTGNYSAPAAAVRDGFMTAYYRRPEPRPEIVVYDSSAPGSNINQLAQQAALAGANIIVGPLQKNNVSQLAQSQETGIPVLALNYLEQPSYNNGYFFQFGLSPEDEAAQVAERAMDDGRLNALAFVPNTNWGRRTLRAFQDRLISRGGQLLDFAFYDPSQTDFREPLTRVLKYKRKTDKEPASIREDMDYIFLAAQPKHARLIRPQLRFYRASRVPVYATSHVYAGRTDAQKDQDLNGIRFGDMPWILDRSSELRDVRKTAAKLWPETYARLPRLYALGYDAYALSSQIMKNNLRPGLGYPAASGVLTLEDSGKISRGLVWAHFTNGQAKLIGSDASSKAQLQSEELIEYPAEAAPE